MDFSQETILQFVQDKVLRFSKQNAIFSQVAEEDLGKLDLLHGTSEVRRIRITQ